MAHIHEILAGHLEWAWHAVPLLLGAPPGVLLAFQRRGLGRRGLGRRPGSFGLFRLLFVLLFTTALGPIVLVALVAFVAYRFFAGRRSR